MHTRLKTKKLQFCSFSKILLRCFCFFACSDILSNFWDNRCNDLRSSSPSSLTRDEFLIKSEHLKHLLMTISWRQFPHVQNHLVLQLYKQRLRFFFIRRRFSYANVKINIAVIIQIKVFLFNTTRLQLFQILCKQFKWVIHIFNTCCLCFLGNSSFSETVDHCSRGYGILGLDQHTLASKMLTFTSSLPASLNWSWCLTTNER